MIQVLLIEDQNFIRLGIEQIISKAADIEIVDWARNEHDALAKIRSKAYDVALLDVDIADNMGLNILISLKGIQPDLPVLAFSLCNKALLGLQALKAGANGFITRADGPDIFIGAIRKVIHNGTYLSPGFVDRAGSHLFATQNEWGHEKLSNRELQVLLMIGQGKTPTETAKELSLSVKTISTYRSRILEKMNLRSSSEIVYYVVRNRLVV